MVVTVSMCQAPSTGVRMEVRSVFEASTPSAEPRNQSQSSHATPFQCMLLPLPLGSLARLHSCQQW